MDALYSCVIYNAIAFSNLPCTDYCPRKAGVYIREIFLGGQPQFIDKGDFPQAKFSEKDGFPPVPTSTSTNGVLQTS